MGGYASLLQVLRWIVIFKIHIYFKVASTTKEKPSKIFFLCKGRHSQTHQICSVCISLQHSLGYWYLRYKDLRWHWYSTHSSLGFNSRQSPEWPWTWGFVSASNCYQEDNGPMPSCLAVNCFLIINAIISVLSYFLCYFNLDALNLGKDI